MKIQLDDDHRERMRTMIMIMTILIVTIAITMVMITIMVMMMIGMIMDLSSPSDSDRSCSRKSRGTHTPSCTGLQGTNIMAMIRCRWIMMIMIMRTMMGTSTHLYCRRARSSGYDSCRFRRRNQNFHDQNSREDNCCGWWCHSIWWGYNFAISMIMYNWHQGRGTNILKSKSTWRSAHFSLRSCPQSSQPWWGGNRWWCWGWWRRWCWWWKPGSSIFPGHKIHGLSTPGPAYVAMMVIISDKDDHLLLEILFSFTLPGVSAMNWTTLSYIVVKN